MSKRENIKVFAKFKRLANIMIDIKANIHVTIILNFKNFIYCLIITIAFNYYLYKWSNYFIVLTLYVTKFQEKIKVVLKIRQNFKFIFI
jgi:hypothetical protein